MIHTEEILLILQIAYLERKKTYIILFFEKDFRMQEILNCLLFYFYSKYNLVFLDSTKESKNSP